jgi:FkbM family methyltransferase
MMGWRQRVGAVVVDGATRVAGRRFVVRVSRFALNRARLDIPNSIETNGELMLQRHVVASAEPGATIRVFDVGANRGDWSLSMLGCAADGGRSGDLDLHAFEASAFTSEQLRASVGDRITRVNQVALSDHGGSGRLVVVSPGGGTNSLTDATDPEVATEVVELTTVDDYCAQHAIAAVDLLKVDTEGHDLLVLLGARAMLERQAISVVQFEYNHRWIGQRRFLRDAFELLEPLGYTLGKLTPRGVETYPRGWDWELESFVEGNYVAWPREGGPELARIEWWKSPSTSAREKRGR